MIEKEIGDDNLFKQFKQTMNNHELIEDLEGDLISYMGKMKAKNFASKLFKELGKDKIMLNKVEYLYRELR